MRPVFCVISYTQVCDQDSNVVTMQQDEEKYPSLQLYPKFNPKCIHCEERTAL